MVYYAYRAGSFRREIGRQWRGRRDQVTRVETRNVIHSSTAEAIRRDMEHVGRLSSTEQPAWCFAIGWTSHEYEHRENISADTLVGFADRFFERARIPDTQRVYLIHGDGSDPHLHAVVNGIDVRSETLHQWDHVRYMKALWRVEQSDPRRTYYREKMREEKGGPLNIRELIRSHEAQRPYVWLVRQETRNVFERHWQRWPRLQRNLAKRGFVLRVEPRQDWPETLQEEETPSQEDRWRGLLTDGDRQISLSKVWPHTNVFKDIGRRKGDYTSPDVGRFPRPTRLSFYQKLRHASLEETSQACPELLLHSRVLSRGEPSYKEPHNEETSKKSPAEIVNDLEESVERLEKLLDDDPSEEDGRTKENSPREASEEEAPRKEPAVKVSSGFWLGQARLLKRLGYLTDREALLDRCPTGPEVLAERGILARQKGRPPDEIQWKYLRPAFQKSPSSWLPSIQLGISHARSGDTKSSLSLFRKALEIGKKNRSPEQQEIARGKLAKHLKRAGKKEEAQKTVGTEEIAEDVLQIPYENRSYASQRLLLERLHQNRSRYGAEGQLLELAQSLTEVDPTSPRGWLWQGRCTSGPRSLENYRRAVEIAPLWKLPRMEIIEQLRRMPIFDDPMRLDMLREHIGKLLALDSESAKGWYWRGVRSVKDERFEEALWSIEKLEDVRDDALLQDWYWKGRAYYGLGDLEQASSCFKRAARNEYKDASERTIEALRECGRLLDAIDLIDQKLEAIAQEDAPLPEGVLHDSVYKSNLLKKKGQMQEELDCPEEALESYSEAIEEDLDPGTPESSY